MHSVRAEADREYYEEMIRQAKISQSAQSEDSDLGRLTTGSGYAELVALREMDSGQGASASEPVVNGAPAVGVKETEIDASTEGVAIVGVAVGGGAGMAENSSEVQLLREESTESSEGGVPSSRLIENGVLNPISEEAEEGDYPEEKAAPYLVSLNNQLSDYSFIHVGVGVFGLFVEVQKISSEWHTGLGIKSTCIMAHIY